MSNEKLVAFKKQNVFFSSDHLLYVSLLYYNDDRWASGKFRTESINKLISTICLLGFNLTEIKYNQVINRRGEIQRGLLYFFKLEISTTTSTSRCAPTAQRRCNFRDYSCTRYSTQAAPSRTTWPLPGPCPCPRPLFMSMSIMMATFRNRLSAQGTKGSLRWSQCTLCTIQCTAQGEFPLEQDGVKSNNISRHGAPKKYQFELIYICRYWGARKKRNQIFSSWEEL